MKLEKNRLFATFLCPSLGIELGPGVVTDLTSHFIGVRATESPGVEHHVSLSTPMCFTFGYDVVARRIY